MFAGYAAYYAGGPGVTLTGDGRQLHLDAMFVSRDYFSVFGAPLRDIFNSTQAHAASRWANIFRFYFAVHEHAC